MSSAEITLGSHLFVKATEEQVDQLIKNNPDYTSLSLAFRDMAKWLAKRKCVSKGQDGAWNIDNDGITKVSEQDAQRFLPYYQTAVMAHEQAASHLIRDGKTAYMAEFRELHADQLIEIMPDTVTRVRGDDMRAIASASLTLLDAVHNDPTNAVFVKGLDSASMDTLWSVMHDMGFLMPGENPDREAPLGDQVLRGSPEEQEALFYHVKSIAANLDLPDTMTMGDRPLAAAIMLKEVVDGAHVEEVLADPATEKHSDSDLTRQDCNSIYNVLMAATRMIHTAQWDTQSLDSLLVDPRLADDLKVALDDYRGNYIDNCLTSGNFGDPKIGNNMAKRLASGIFWLNSAMTSDMESERFTGDDGGMLTQEGQTMAEDGEFGREFSSELDGEESEENDSAPKIMGAEGDLYADIYGASERKRRVPEAMIRSADLVILEVLDNGTAEYLRQRAGRPEMEMGDVSTTSAAFGSLDEAMGEYREATAESRGHNPKVITFAQKANMSQENQARIRAVPISEGRAPFEDYTHGAPSIADQRVTRYMNDNMLLADGRPNLALRAWCREAHEKGVQVHNRAEGDAAFLFASRFVERERHHYEQIRDENRDKKGITEISFASEDIARMIKVKEASGTEPFVRLVMNADGSASLTDKDKNVPKLTARMSKTPEEVTKSADSPRKFGGNVDLEWLKAAYETGAKEVTLLVSGEAPYAAIGKLDQAPERKKTKAQQVTLS